MRFLNVPPKPKGLSSPQLPLRTAGAVDKGRLPSAQRVLQEMSQAFLTTELHYKLLSKFYLKLGKLKSNDCSKHPSYNLIIFYLSPLAFVLSLLSASAYQFVFIPSADCHPSHPAVIPETSRESL